MKLFLMLLSLTGSLLLPSAPVFAAPDAQQHIDLKHYAPKIVHDFIASTTPEETLENAELPSVAVKLTADVIYFDRANNLVVVPPAYDQLPPAVQQQFRAIAPDNDSNVTAEFYQLLFNQFLIAHEAAHWLQHATGKSAQMNRYEAEMDANRLAASYWAKTTSGRDMLIHLRSQLHEGQQRLTNPMPEGADAETYFHENYDKLGQSANDYGYFQYQFILAAIDSVI